MSAAHASVGRSRRRAALAGTIDQGTNEVLGPKIEVPIVGVSAATQNLLLLRHVELGSTLPLVVSVLKVRDGAHDRTIRELVIDDAGLHIEDALAG